MSLKEKTLSNLQLLPSCNSSFTKIVLNFREKRANYAHVKLDMGGGGGGCHVVVQGKCGNFTLLKSKVQEKNYIIVSV